MATTSVIATMDTGSRRWDYEMIPAARVETALERASEWLGQLGAHLVLNGPDPDALPDRDFSHGLAVQVLSLPERLPAGDGGGSRGGTGTR